MVIIRKALHLYRLANREEKYYMGMKKILSNKLYLKWLGVGIGLGVILFFYLCLTTEDEVRFINSGTFVSQPERDTLTLGDLSLRYSEEYRTWKNTRDTSFRSQFNGNQSVDLLAERPNLVILWAGYAFSKSYASPRGHSYAIDDNRRSLRTGAPTKWSEGPQSASCWACKSPDVPRLMRSMGVDSFYRQSWSALGSEIVNPIGCADCHDAESMELIVSRPFLRTAFERRGTPLENASEQEMQILVCAQCHSEYYLKGQERVVTFPWDKGYSVEEIEAYYDEIGFTDFTHKLSRTPLLKAQHPDFELAGMGIHAQRGLSCADCHMPYVGNEENRYKNHHIQSPLAMIDRTCQVCHRQTEETLRNNVYERQSKVLGVRQRVETELAKAHIEAKFAWDRGASEAQMEKILKLIRQAQWRWDFAVASHGASFHAPQEVIRMLADGLDKAMQARLELTRVLTARGYTGEVPMPDISSKEKAQHYIGVDIKAEEAAKKQFLQTIVPEWIEEAKANGRLTE